MDFPRRPSRNEDPWYSARETYDQAIEDAVRSSYRYHGEIPSGLHVDDLRTQAYHGIWFIASSRPIDGLPVEPVDGGVLEIIHSGNASGVIQKYTTADQSWWRERRGITSNPDVWWHPWTRYLGSDSIGNIITSTDVERPINEGDLLVVVDAEDSVSYLADFFNEPYGESPQGWTDRGWGPDAGITIENESLSSNGRVMHQPDLSTSSRRALSIDHLDGATDTNTIIDVIVKWRGSENSAIRMIGQGSGNTSETADGYVVGRSRLDDSMILYTFRDGQTATSPNYSADGYMGYSEGEWNLMRFRYHPGNSMRGKSWHFGDQEPSGWGVTGSLNPSLSKPGGWIGLMHTGPGWSQVDWVGIALGGGRAPTGS